MSRREEKKARTAGIRLLKIIYIVAMVVSALIVTCYCLWTFAIRPPKVDRTPPVTPIQTSQPPLSGEPDGQATEEVPPEPDEPVLAVRDEVYTCLIFGMDDGNGNTDTIMVATFDVPNQKIGLLSIPRDTIVSQEHSAAMNKVNAAYARGGVEMLDQELEELLGFPVDFYVKIRLSAFKKLVNAIGGVYFDVPINMNYDDPYQDLHIHISKGYQRLNGEQAMGLVRYRQDNYGNDSFGDTGRAGVQQDFLKAMLSQVMASASIDTIPDLIDILLNYVETDIGAGEMLYFGKALLGMDVGSAITAGTLPADWHSPYMWVDEDAALPMINELINPYNMEITPDMVEFFKR